MVLKRDRTGIFPVQVYLTTSEYEDDEVEELYNILRFLRAFSSVVRQMPGYNAQRQGTARTLPNQKLCCCMY